MGIGRFAGDIFLRNPIARSAQVMADRPLSWLERQGLSVEQLREVGVNRWIAAGPEKTSEYFLTEDQKDLRRYVSHYDPARANNLAEAPLGKDVENMLERPSDATVYALGRMVDNSGQHSGFAEGDPRRGIAQLARELAVPLAADASVAGGAVLAYEVLRRLLTGEPSGQGGGAGEEGKTPRDSA